jgi:hypothetical protein
MSTLLTITAWLGLVCVALAAAVIAVVIWIAAGESDALDAAARDAGATDEEIERMSRSWDVGSRATATQPCLEHARALNRRAMRNQVIPTHAQTSIPTHHGR